MKSFVTLRCCVRRSDHPDAEPDTTRPVNTNESYCAVVRSRLHHHSLGGWNHQALCRISIIHKYRLFRALQDDYTYWNVVISIRWRGGLLPYGGRQKTVRGVEDVTRNRQPATRRELQTVHLI